MGCQGCTMGHLHDISHVGYATIYDFLSLESFPGTPVHVRLVLPLGADLMEFRCLSFLCLRELKNTPKSPKKPLLRRAKRLSVSR